MDINKFGLWMTGFVKRHNEMAAKLNKGIKMQNEEIERWNEANSEKRRLFEKYRYVEPYFEGGLGSGPSDNFLKMLDDWKISRNSISGYLKELYFALSDTDKARLGDVVVVNPEQFDKRILQEL